MSETKRAPTPTLAETKLTTDEMGALSGVILFYLSNANPSKEQRAAVERLTTKLGAVFKALEQSSSSEQAQLEELRVEIVKEWAKHFKEMGTYFASLRDEIAMGKVYLDQGESAETKAYAINQQSKTIELIIKGLDNGIKQIDGFIKELGLNPESLAPAGSVKRKEG